VGRDVPDRAGDPAIALLVCLEGPGALEQLVVVLDRLVESSTSSPKEQRLAHELLSYIAERPFSPDPS
jgi:hypothetical protein